MPLPSPFRTITEEEKTKRIDAKKAQIDHINESIKAAKLCINSPLFKVYAERYRESRKILIKQFEELEWHDEVTFAVKAKSIQDALRYIGALLVDVTKDAERELINENDVTS